MGHRGETWLHEEETLLDGGILPVWTSAGITRVAVLPRLFTALVSVSMQVGRLPLQVSTPGQSMSTQEPMGAGNARDMQKKKDMDSRTPIS